MANSKRARTYKDLMTALRNRFRDETGAGETLEKAKEVRIGLHAVEQAFQSTGIYLMPASLRFYEDETDLMEDDFTIRCVVMARSHGGDASDSDPATFDILELVGGIVDLVADSADRDIVAGALTGTLHLEDGQDGRATEFVAVPLEAGGFVYRAEVRVRVRIEVVS